MIEDPWYIVTIVLALLLMMLWLCEKAERTLWQQRAEHYRRMWTEEVGFDDRKTYDDWQTNQTD